MKNIGSKNFWDNLRGKLATSIKGNIIELENISLNTSDFVKRYISIKHYDHVTRLENSMGRYNLHIINVGVPNA